MEACESSGRLIREWETGGMEEHGCRCGGGGGGAASRRRDPLTQTEKRLQRLVQVLTVACVLLLSVTVVLLLTFVIGARTHHATGGQPRKQPPNNSGYAKQQNLDELQNPRAMLTAPTGTEKVSGAYLQWENETGRAFCHGGFSYFNGSLVVPRNGIYRVFLQITYESNCDYEELKLLTKVHYIASDYKEERCILSSVDTVNCNMDLNEQWRKSLYTSGLFYLNADSRLRVTSTHHSLIAQNEHEVFFGAELLPP